MRSQKSDSKKQKDGVDFMKPKPFRMTLIWESSPLEAIRQGLYQCGDWVRGSGECEKNKVPRTGTEMSERRLPYVDDTITEQTSKPPESPLPVDRQSRGGGAI
jgi:hypothetical protein